MEKEKAWYKSKTKVGAVLMGVSAVLGTLAGMVQGSVPLAVGLQTLSVELGAVYMVFGFRDLPFVNKK